jgi:hypothetical protein
MQSLAPSKQIEVFWRVLGVAYDNRWRAHCKWESLFRIGHVKYDRAVQKYGVVPGTVYCVPHCIVTSCCIALRMLFGLTLDWTIEPMERLQPVSVGPSSKQVMADSYISKG